jgi:uncharacterized membrane protein (Fun14 family)
LNSDIFTPGAATAGGGFFGGLLLGYTIKKVFKLIAVITELSITGLAYLQYQQSTYKNIILLSSKEYVF